MSLQHSEFNDYVNQWAAENQDWINEFQARLQDDEDGEFVAQWVAENEVWINMYQAFVESEPVAVPVVPTPVVPTPVVPTPVVPTLPQAVPVLDVLPHDAASIDEYVTANNTGWIREFQDNLEEEEYNEYSEWIHPPVVAAMPINYYDSEFSDNYRF